MQRIFLRRRAAEPFGRLDPGRVRRTIVVAEAGDLLRVKLDAAGRRRQLVRRRIGAEFVEHHVFVGALRDFEIAVGPEAVEIGNGRLRWCARCRASCRRGGAAMPISSRPLRECVLAAEPPRQRGEDGIIVARLADRLDRLLHGDARSGRAAREPMSLRSSVVVAGSTMSAWRAVAVHHGSCTMMVSGRRNAARSWLMSW